MLPLNVHDNSFKCSFPFSGKLDEIEKDKSPDIKENGEEKPLDLEDEEGKEEDDSADAQRIEELKGNTYVT